MIPCQDSQPEFLNAAGKARHESHIEGRQGKEGGRWKPRPRALRSPDVGGCECRTLRGCPLAVAGAS